MSAVHQHYYTVFRQHTQCDTNYPRGSPWDSDPADLRAIPLHVTHSAKTIPLLSLQHELKNCVDGILKMDLQSLVRKVKSGYLADLGNQLHSSVLQVMQYSFGLDNETQPRLLATALLVGVWKIFSPLSANRVNNTLQHPARLN